MFGGNFGSIRSGVNGWKFTNKRNYVSWSLIMRCVKSLSKVVVVFIMIFLLMPRSATLEAFQKNLWTSHRSVRDHRTDDVQFDKRRAIDALVSWRRIWLGFPFKAVTIDYPIGSLGSFQFRLESLFLIINIVSGMIFGFIVGIFILAVRKLKK